MVESGLWLVNGWQTLDGGLIMKKYFHLIGILGLLLALYGLFSAIFFANIFWYSYFVIGGTFFLAYINFRCRKPSILEQQKIYLAKTYILYLLITFLIEAVGRFWLHFWEYPSFTLFDQIIHVFLIGYPFAFFFISESLTLIKKKVSSLTLTIVIATLANAFLHEIPNIFAWEWKYTIPLVTFEIFGINVVVLLGWVILIAVPLSVKKMVK